MSETVAVRRPPRVDDCTDGSDESAEVCFVCDNDELVSPFALCDGVDDCGDGTDERDENEVDCFTCDDGGVTPDFFVCDGGPDCEDGSDEEGCFACDDGGITHPDWVCDGFEDCDDGSDEDDCAFCLDDFSPLLPEQLCDGTADCDDSSDEGGFYCFVCEVAGAVSYDVICDGTDDCIDGSDEVEDPCFLCENDALITPFAQCDGVDDCGDGSDEQDIGDADCFTCDDGGVTPDLFVCDGFGDCADGSDEVGCFVCENDVVVPQSWVCDGFDDCGDNSDEDESLCFVCDNEDVIRGELVCNDADDCGDGSDELGCTVDVCSVSDGTIACGDTLSATTVGADDDLNLYPACDTAAGYTGGDLVYALTPDVTGTARVLLSGANHADEDLDLVALAGGCDLEEQTCAAWGLSIGGLESADVEVVEGETVYLVVDGWEGAEDAFDLTVCCPTATSVAVDGVLACDTPLVDNNADYESEHSTYAACGLIGTTWGGGDPTYELIAPVTGTYDVAMTWGDAGQDLDVVVLRGCPDRTSECLDSSTGVGVASESLSFDAEAGDHLFFVVDGWNSGADTFTLTVSCPE